MLEKQIYRTYFLKRQTNIARGKKTLKGQCSKESLGACWPSQTRSPTGHGRKARKLLKKEEKRQRPELVRKRTKGPQTNKPMEESAQQQKIKTEGEMSAWGEQQ